MFYVYQLPSDQRDKFLPISYLSLCDKNRGWPEHTMGLLDVDMDIWVLLCCRRVSIATTIAMITVLMTLPRPRCCRTKNPILRWWECQLGEDCHGTTLHHWAFSRTLQSNGRGRGETTPTTGLLPPPSPSPYNTHSRCVCPYIQTIKNNQQHKKYRRFFKSQ